MLDVTYNGQQTVSVEITGSFLSADFDSDGDVDFGDLAQWQGNFGLNSESDADNDGDSDGADFLVWQSQLGSGLATPAGAAVPEPAALTLLLVGLLTISSRHRAIA
jgi:hypothetical protein